MGIALVFLGMGLCTFLPRYLPLALWGGRELPASAKTVLGFVPPAVLAAIVIPSLMTPTGTKLDLQWTNPYLIGGGMALLASLVSKRILLSSAVGVGVFFAVHALFAVRP